MAIRHNFKKPHKKMTRKIKVLNAYAGIGGNRKLWNDNDIEVTAVENNKQIADLYKKYHPKDKVILGDAHKYILRNYKYFDFIWSSVPCPSHSRARYWSSKGGLLEPIYPDMSLWQEILFLSSFCDTKWVVENVESYYPKILSPIKCGNHYFWTNFRVLPFRDGARKTDVITTKTTHYGYNLEKENVKDKIKILRNLVNPKLGLHIFECAFKEKQKSMMGFFETLSPSKKEGCLIENKRKANAFPNG